MQGAIDARYMRAALRRSLDNRCLDDAHAFSKHGGTGAKRMNRPALGHVVERIVEVRLTAQLGGPQRQPCTFASAVARALF